MEHAGASTTMELDDDQLGHAMRLGALAGVPVMFVVFTLMGVAWYGWSALALAMVPAAVAGPFLGGFVTLMWMVSAHEKKAVVVPMAEPETGIASVPKAA